MRRSSRTSKIEPLPSSLLSPVDKSRGMTSTTITSTRKPIDPLAKRLNHIRIHLLNSKVHRHIIPPEPTCVFEKFLYLGGLKSLHDKDRLARLNITHILSVVWIRPKKESISSDIKHLFIKADDCISFDMSKHFEQACQFIDDARQSNGSVLVHCACGVSRSTTLCCAYLIKHHAMSAEQAITQLRSRRHIIQPNSAFLRQLILYSDQIESERATVDSMAEQLNNTLDM